MIILARAGIEILDGLEPEIEIEPEWVSCPYCYEIGKVRKYLLSENRKVSVECPICLGEGGWWE